MLRSDGGLPKPWWLTMPGTALWLVMSVASLSADEPAVLAPVVDPAGPSVGDRAPSTSAPAASPPATASTATRERQRQQAFLGFAALGGIVITGVALIAGVLVWSGRLRRLMRSPLKPCPPLDPFWYLSAPKPERPPVDPSASQ